MCNSSIKDLLNDWYNYKSKLDSGEILMEEYTEQKAARSEISNTLFNRKPFNIDIKEQYLLNQWYQNIIKCTQKCKKRPI